MRNILSYQSNTAFTGKEILAWAAFQVNNQTSHIKQGQKILKLYSETLNPSRYYYVRSSYETAGCGDIRHEPLIIKKLDT